LAHRRSGKRSGSGSASGRYSILDSADYRSAKPLSARSECDSWLTVPSILAIMAISTNQLFSAVETG
jgi:hypothetical protein